MELGDDPGIKPVGIGSAIAKAYDVERGGNQQLQPRLGGDTAREIARQLAAPRDLRADMLAAIGLQREPGLQGVEAAREIGAEIARPGRAAGESPRLAPQISRRRREGGAMLLTVAHQDEAGVVRDLT